MDDAAHDVIYDGPNATEWEYLAGEYTFVEEGAPVLRTAGGAANAPAAGWFRGIYVGKELRRGMMVGQVSMRMEYYYLERLLFRPFGCECELSRAEQNTLDRCCSVGLASKYKRSYSITAAGRHLLEEHDRQKAAATVLVNGTTWHVRVSVGHLHGHGRSAVDWYYSGPCVTVYLGKLGDYVSGEALLYGDRAMAHPAGVARTQDLGRKLAYSQALAARGWPPALRREAWREYRRVFEA